ncbi:GNAT family N-acetyltransferase [Pedobacter rhizosphaerae]|uniref:Acetyltransferase (GNAT) domain-containing protein n=1 Tax=Pedobacter rhizosphaerae TaxID=390241 RepID=A0A1H9M6K1_9SPHI|nr:GNAT family N-acetyltransferase [Pedobacter rhizosphaerae]SER18753.1 Acetyltransferase (GNAT) domain-containing protein [Pedobacter rhizosphaerae]
MKKIITIEDKLQWTNYIKRALHYDFYHTWYYHSLDKTGFPILFVYEENQNFIAFPLLKRNIPGSDFFDFTSVYGYTGPISNLDFKVLEDDFMEGFKASFIEYLQTGQNVTVFSRLHPFFDQERLMGKFSGVHANGKTVAIDLTTTIEEQRSVYRKSVKEKIRRLRKRDYLVKVSNDISDARIFADIYIENMQRVGAKEYYFFSESYFVNLLASDEFDSKLFLVYKDGEPISGAVVVCTDEIMQVHLLATKTKYLNESPAKLLTDEITVIGRQLGYKYFNLGGGVNFKEDNLFGWKMGFSKLCFEFNSWRYIANNDLYNSLLEEKAIDNTANIDFFPLYRNPVMA